MKQNTHGFTLIELLVVIGIIGVLATLAVVALDTARSQARATKARADLKNINTAIDILAVDTGEWPGHQVPYKIAPNSPVVAALPMR